MRRRGIVGGDDGRMHRLDADDARVDATMRPARAKGSSRRARRQTVRREPRTSAWHRTKPNCASCGRGSDDLDEVEAAGVRPGRRDICARDGAA